MLPEPTGLPGPIDRDTPRVRPVRPAVMRQDWTFLLFLHWEVPAERIRPLLPPGLELDLYQGKAYVGLVPFTMSGVRPIGVPAIPFLSRFHETNVRTYVHVEGRDPGVWFFSLDAANPLAVVTARAWFHLPYHHARMRLSHESPGSGTTTRGISYSSERLWPGPKPASCTIQCVPKGPIAPATAGTLEHFLAERYLLYASHRGRLYRGQVHHTPYPLQSADVTTLEESLLSAAGLPRPDVPPLAHFSQGVCVEVFPLTILP
ncbi:YqjF family protein [Singulisphaera acidiphila]|uniref:DUF2071 domain-containing protein n=1 Tax=Singulisphaera acidiphila (strain ATCC BAA-1392 / DSM 18658 / VKM B-2454 / MOB10) TaxID=886293 RepID=L0DR07_SINAD|nr:DUF2071 domain-containing protein [Singulisphaera acidiphila]AGA31392.1 hypothetical protein Sinac_7353 [Singulisphaera acidiphila DSM 18658]